MSSAIKTTLNFCRLVCFINSQDAVFCCKLCKVNTNYYRISENTNFVPQVSFIVAVGSYVITIFRSTGSMGISLLLSVSNLSQLAEPLD